MGIHDLLIVRCHPAPPAMYTLTPAAGTIAPGASEEVTLRFSPTEVEDCERLLQCTIPDLDAGCPPLTRPVGGKVLRPWCHFELAESDYISGGRRNPEQPGPSGAIEPLDPATKVCIGPFRMPIYEGLDLLAA